MPPAADPSAHLTSEARARVEIDRMLGAGGWAVQDASAVDLAAARGVAVREFVMRAPHGRADYLLSLRTCPPWAEPLPPPPRG